MPETECDSLFNYEEVTISDAEDLLESDLFLGNPAARPYKDLLKKYRKLFRQLQRLVKISDRMQQDLNLLNDRIKQSEEKYRTIFENVAEGIYRALPGGRLVDVNPAMARAFGYDTPADFLQHVDNIYDRLFLDDKEEQSFRRIMMDQGRTENFQARMVCKDDRTIWVEISARTILDRQGGLLHTEGLVQDITERRRLQEELRTLATTDGLTRLYNRRYFMELAKRELSRAKRRGSPLGLLLIDVDRFKSVNDTFGHDIGDQTLKALTTIGRETFREYDIFCRYGGEEFTVLLPDTDLNGALQVAERFRQSVAAYVLPTEQGPLSFTVSIGLTTLSEETPDVEALLKKADIALYSAKTNGRNRVEILLDTHMRPNPTIENH